MWATIFVFDRRFHFFVHFLYIRRKVRLSIALVEENSVFILLINLAHLISILLLLLSLQQSSSQIQEDPVVWVMLTFYSMSSVFTVNENAFVIGLWWVRFPFLSVIRAFHTSFSEITHKSQWWRIDESCLLKRLRIMTILANALILADKK